MHPNNKFRTIIFDFDSTLVSIEGINELARLTGKLTAVAKLTREAMDGRSKFEDVFFKRLDLVKPTLSNLRQLSHLYRHCLVPHAQEVIQELKRQGKTVMIVTGGYKQAILPTAIDLGIYPSHVWAIELTPDHQGYYTQAKPDHIQPTTTGKRDLIRFLAPKPRIAFIGDGANDILVKPLVDLFIGFGGVATHQLVKRMSHYYITQNSLLPILDIINQEESI